MNFDLTDEQSQLQDSLRRVLADHCSFEQRGRHLESPEGFSRALWTRYAELGLLALTLPEAHGGFGGNAADSLLVMEALGAVMATEPYLATVVLGARAIALAGTEAQQEKLLPQVADGSLLLAWAHQERAGRHDPAHVATRAQRDARGGWRLAGGKSLVLHGAAADLLVVSARVAGLDQDDAGLRLFLVDPADVGVNRRAYRLLDGSLAAEIDLSHARAELLGGDSEAWAVILQVQAAGLAAVTAQAVGAMQAALDLSVGHLKAREQFGRAIGANQALQHRAADMLVATEQARSMAMLAAMLVDDAEAADRERQLSMAKLVVNREARTVAQQAVQLHGGIGMTMEYPAGHFMRYLAVCEQLFGDSAWHQRRLAAS